MLKSGFTRILVFAWAVIFLPAQSFAQTRAEWGAARLARLSPSEKTRYDEAALDYRLKLRRLLSLESRFARSTNAGDARALLKEVREVSGEIKKDLRYMADRSEGLGPDLGCVLSLAVLGGAVLAGVIWAVVEEGEAGAAVMGVVGGMVVGGPVTLGLRRLLEASGRFEYLVYPDRLWKLLLGVRLAEQGVPETLRENALGKFVEGRAAYAKWIVSRRDLKEAIQRFGQMLDWVAMQEPLLEAERALILELKGRLPSTPRVLTKKWALQASDKLDQVERHFFGTVVPRSSFLSEIEWKLQKWGLDERKIEAALAEVSNGAQLVEPTNVEGLELLSVLGARANTSELIQLESWMASLPQLEVVGVKWQDAKPPAGFSELATLALKVTLPLKGQPAKVFQFEVRDLVTESLDLKTIFASQRSIELFEKAMGEALEGALPEYTDQLNREALARAIAADCAEKMSSSEELEKQAVGR